MRISVVTFNLRMDTPHDGRDRFQFRKGLILDKIETEKPDVIGFQECLPEMAAFLRSHLNGYLCVGNGRSSSFDGENNMIAFRTERFELMALDTFWLSDAPHVPGSRFKVQSACPRVCTHIVLREWDGKAPFHVYNTHLDHEAWEAREQGAQEVVQRIMEDRARWPYPCVLTGDMNAAPTDKELAPFYEAMTDCTANIANSYHGYGERYDLERIDYIFTHGFRALGPACAWDEKLHDLHLSDHNPLCVGLEAEE